ncbi:uncharacterized protein LOC124353541 [Homalodisca vitripennis]|uniref:uncharacterized protein LOC124353541 n=1 Tax=Homalodisca vitripennis TaxID=197043 RepID=UPI001EEC5F4A|nr:uncharacterized protein LOC124353541 [Homalodisca vitripennis]
MWTMMSAGVIYHSLFKVTPVALCRVCRLLLKYHRDYLPQLRTHHPQFYNECQNKISISSKYVQELINMLWTGQAMSRREDGVVLKQWSEESITNQLKCKVDLDTVMDLTHNTIFLPYFIRERENNGIDFLKQKKDFFIVIQYYLEDITNFIKYFSPVFQTP